MNIYSQKQIVYKLLVKDYKSGAKGINSVFIRNTYGIVDVATRMFDNKENFKKLGLEYDKRLEKNRTATYFLKPLDDSPTFIKSKGLDQVLQPRKTKWETYTNVYGDLVSREVSI